MSSGPELEPLGDEMFLNTERRCPVVLLLDTSSSMSPFMSLVNQGLTELRDDLKRDALASQRVELSVVTFGPVELAQDFVSVEQWVPPKLIASGNTPLGEALVFAIAQIRQRKAAYREAGIPYYRPWIWLVTDGAPTDHWRKALPEVHSEVGRSGIEVFTIGTDNADFNVLAEVGRPRSPIRLKHAHYREMFVWLSRSLKPVSRSEPGSELALPAMAEWGDAVP